MDARKPARIAHQIPPKIRRYVLLGDRGRCIVPGCANRDPSTSLRTGCLEVHHVVPRASGGDHDPRRLATLCPAHHAAVHEGSLRIAGEAPAFRFIDARGIELSADAEALRAAQLSVILACPHHADMIRSRTWRRG